jgi:hypothetical protein
MPTSSIWIRFQFEGYHRWKDAPDEVAFLRDRHRHLFHVRVEWPVRHADRDREFFIEQHAAQRAVAALQAVDGCEEWSCEHWATRIMEATGASRVDVSEDGENGATVCSQ